MQLLQRRILRDGVVKEGNVIKVDAFLNHQIDVELLDELGKEFFRRFRSTSVTKILTIETSGIGIACFAARHFGVPVVFAKKTQSINLDGDVYATKVESYTHKRIYDVIVAKRFLSPGDRVLLIDDLLANGCALLGLIQLVRDAGAEIAGAGVVIEKGFQVGGETVRRMGIHLESLAVIDQMKNGRIVFRTDNAVLEQGM